MTTAALQPAWPDAANDAVVRRTGDRLLWAAAALLVACTIGRLVHVLPAGAQLDQGSGVFTALAKDISEGVFYRPLFAADGYGGTRYFPLHPTLHAALMKFGLPPLAAGYTIALAAGLAMLAGTYRLMRAFGVRAGIAAPAATFVFATVSGQWAVSTIRCDLLPAALNVWGLTFVAASGRPGARCRPLVAAICFTLAFSAKMTSVFGLVAAIASLLLARRRREAWQLALFTLIGIALFFWLAQWASHGRFVRVMRACATSDGDLHTLLTAPVAMLVLSMRVDSMAPAFWLLAFGTLLCVPRAAWRELPALALLCTAGVTLFIFGSPGTAINHCLDLHVIALVFFVAQFARERVPSRVGIVLLATTGLLATAGTMQLVRDIDRVPNAARFASTLRQVRDVRGPVLFEHPILPVLAGRRPYVLDPYMYAVVKSKRPPIAQDLEDKLDAGAFGAVVLLADPSDPKFADWFDVAFFGPGFRRHLLDHYRLLPPGEGHEFVFVPKGSGDVASTDEGSADEE